MHEESAVTARGVDRALEELAHLVSSDLGWARYRERPDVAGDGMREARHQLGKRETRLHRNQRERRTGMRGGFDQPLSGMFDEEREEERGDTARGEELG